MSFDSLIPSPPFWCPKRNKISWRLANRGCPCEGNTHSPLWRKCDSKAWCHAPNDCPIKHSTNNFLQWTKDSVQYATSNHIDGYMWVQYVTIRSLPLLTHVECALVGRDPCWSRWTMIQISLPRNLYLMCYDYEEERHIWRSLWTLEDNENSPNVKLI